MTLDGRSRVQSDGRGVYGLSKRDAPIYASPVPYIRQAGVSAVTGANSGISMNLHPLVGSVVIVHVSREISAWSSSSVEGGGINTWNRVAAGKFTTGSGSVSGAMHWGVVGPWPSAYLRGFVDGTISAHYSWMEIVGLTGTQRYAETINSVNTNPATATFATVRTRYPGCFMVVASISQNAAITPTGFTQGAAGTTGARSAWIGYYPSIVQANTPYASIQISSTGSNSRIVGSLLLIE